MFSNLGKAICKLQKKCWRVFCFECTDSKLTRCTQMVCSWRWCSNPCRCENYDVKECCFNHAFCGKYAEWY